MGSAASKVDEPTIDEATKTALEDSKNLPSYLVVMYESEMNKLPPYSVTAPYHPKVDKNDPRTFYPDQYIIEPTDDMHRRVVFVYDFEERCINHKTYCVKPTLSRNINTHFIRRHGYEVYFEERCRLCEKQILTSSEDRRKAREATEKFKGVHKANKKKKRTPNITSRHPTEEDRVGLLE
ncbi:hypothetical protein GLAREA_02262 [Glarea lozoyensis ATCC 20868]|uniref:Uncharacterized protein n=1 Tax=Glarea lozoyensis (strain ATCC 20868 / MF5171) TaxID=1116229 RepID=S3CKS7_GLAL2|nr:uncharacterized protein GLAREA_02262 [Glarea lozoyensis ATCC 20868]EPE26350.1 hypothetical protein GLAREA_02262 [Glarea lozoyensis ATCC 20868]